jgi:hypothetical protein
VRHDRFFTLLKEVLGDTGWPKPLHLLEGAERVRAGDSLSAVSKAVGTTQNRLAEVVGAPDPIREVLGLTPEEVIEEQLRRARQILGQLLLGRCAELAFENIYRSEMHAQEFELRDLRESRTDTDYRLYNGEGRPIYRINIKFHGAQFRRAQELVGLDPLDCFALATYKIHSALQKQEQERLPYFFAIVGVPELTGEVVGRSFPLRFIEAVALMHQAPRARRIRDFEDAVIEHSVQARSSEFEETYHRILNADWYILSARKANQLLRDLLFERVYALRIRGFAQQFRAAELDMHFSLSTDLVKLRDFLATLRNEGLTKVATLMERGEF